MNYKDKVVEFFNRTLDTLFPIRAANMTDEDSCSTLSIDLLKEILQHNINQDNIDFSLILSSFSDQLNEFKIGLDEDVEAIYQGDPAADSKQEIIITYPGFYAIAAYRIANFLHSKGISLIPRIITENAHNVTGIDIHPAATIGRHLCIDHGTGVVIGQTCIIGDNVKIYQGVTLGALSIPKRNVKTKRHPTIEDNVVIYAQATILGGETVIGKNSIVGGNVWLTHSIEPYTKITYRASDFHIENIAPSKAIINS